MSGEMVPRSGDEFSFYQIRDMVESAGWKKKGGIASISSFNGSLIITAPRRIHERIGGALE